MPANMIPAGTKTFSGHPNGLLQQPVPEVKKSRRKYLRLFHFCDNRSVHCLI